jgi:glycosyltransferase involved in cell wall biosynthesis
MIAPPYFEIPPAGYGGIEAVVADLTDALVESGHRVSVIGAGKAGTSGDFIAVWDRAMPERLGNMQTELLHAMRTQRAVGQLAASSRGIDVVHDHTFAGPINAPYYAALGLPTVVTMHGPANHPELVEYYDEVNHHVSLVAISHRQRELAPKLNWIGTVHNALSIDQWPYRADKDDYALFLGRFSAVKGVHLALDACHEAGIRLVMAGKCAEPAEKEYYAQEVEPRLTAADTMFGAADAAAKRELLSGARCLVFPIDWEEPFGMVMIEAMACGTPVVALRSGAVPEIVVDGVTGIICDKPEELADALVAAEQLDPAACRQHVARHFNAAGLARGYVSAYRTAMTAHTAAAGRTA